MVLARACATVLVGISQIFFISHWATGLLITIGIATYSPEAAAFLFLGSLVQTIGAWATGVSADEYKSGLSGFNGALVGIVAFTFCEDSAFALLITLLGGLAVVIVYALLKKLFSLPKLQCIALPISTGPFCIVATCLFFWLPTLAKGGELTSSTEPALGLTLGFFNGFAEVIVADGWLAGVLILTGLVIGSRSAAGFGAIGALLGTLGGILVAGIEVASTGVYTYSAILTAMALGAIFWPQYSTQVRWIGVVIGSLLSVLVTFAMSSSGGPVFTWPYLVSTWILIIIAAVFSTKKSAGSSQAELSTS